MRILLQRVSQASVSIDGLESARIESGLLLLVGISQMDDESVLEYMADKILGLRIFEDKDGKMNLSIRDVGGSILVVSQFTLYADWRRGRRPGFSKAAPAQISLPRYREFVDLLKRSGIRVAEGAFGEHMDVALINDGPVTMMLDSEEK